jgi:small-conductance mechanosensitive channel
MPQAFLDRAQGLLLELLVPLGIALGVTLLLLLARHFLLRWIEGVAGRGKAESLGAILASLRTPTLLWCVILGLAAGLETAAVPAGLATWGTGLLGALIILSITLVAANNATRYFQHIAQRMQIDAALTGLGTALSKVLIYILGGLMVLSALGIAITPLVAAVGVGGIAVAVALQDILSNLFAGIYLLAEKPVRVGDFVKLETGQEGTVADIGWRTTRIRMPPNNTVIIPNGKLTQSVLTVREEPRARPGAVAVGVGGHGTPRWKT